MIVPKMNSKRFFFCSLWIIIFISGEEGGLYAFYGGNNFPSGNATRGCQGVDPCPGVKVISVMCELLRPVSNVVLLPC